jgi:hypothetical protein
VSVTAGGDDLNLFGVAIRCVLYGRDPSNCRRALGLSLGSKATSLTQVQRNLVGLFGAIRAKARNAKVYVLGYPNPLPQLVPKSCVAPLRLWEAGGLLGLRQTDAELFWAVIGMLNRRVQAAARSADVRYFKPFTGHNICSQDPWFFPLASNALTLHPNEDGQAEMAMLLRQAAGRPPS